MDLGSALSAAVGRASKRSKLGRKLSRRLSLVARVPSLLHTKLQRAGAGDPGNTGQRKYAAYNSVQRQAGSRMYDITVIAPDKTQRVVRYFNLGS